jgi:hypothetical protein
LRNLASHSEAQKQLFSPTPPTPISSLSSKKPVTTSALTNSTPLPQSYLATPENVAAVEVNASAMEALGFVPPWFLRTNARDQVIYI